MKGRYQSTNVHKIHTYPNNKRGCTGDAPIGVLANIGWTPNQIEEDRAEILTDGETRLDLNKSRAPSCHNTTTATTTAATVTTKQQQQQQQHRHERNATSRAGRHVDADFTTRALPK
jgi:hypothetical protein